MSACMLQGMAYSLHPRQTSFSSQVEMCLLGTPIYPQSPVLAWLMVTPSTCGHQQGPGLSAAFSGPSIRAPWESEPRIKSVEAVAPLALARELPLLPSPHTGLP